MPRSDTPCVVGLAPRLEVRRNSEKPGALEEYVRAKIIAAVTGDPSRNVRFHATHALAAAGDRASIPLLLEIRAHETDTKLRDAARYALWSLSGKPALAPQVGV